MNIILDEFEQAGEPIIFYWGGYSVRERKLMDSVELVITMKSPRKGIFISTYEAIADELNSYGCARVQGTVQDLIKLVVVWHSGEIKPCKELQDVAEFYRTKYRLPPREVRACWKLPESFAWDGLSMAQHIFVKDLEEGRRRITIAHEIAHIWFPVERYRPQLLLRSESLVEAMAIDSCLHRGSAEAEEAIRYARSLHHKIPGTLSLKEILASDAHCDDFIYGSMVIGLLPLLNTGAYAPPMRFLCDEALPFPEEYWTELATEPVKLIETLFSTWKEYRP
jgi:hypothetical protein